MATPPFNIDQAAPADISTVAAFPANERTNRDIIESMYAIEHDVASGRHKFGTGATAARDAITDWVVGSLWLNTTFVPAMLQRVVSIGPVVWRDVGAFEATATARVFNEDGADVDCRFEGGAVPNLLVLDAGLDAVGVGMVPASGDRFEIRGVLKQSPSLTASGGLRSHNVFNGSVAPAGKLTIVPMADITGTIARRFWMVCGEVSSGINGRRALSFAGWRLISSVDTPLVNAIVTSVDCSIGANTTDGIFIQNDTVSTLPLAGSAFVMGN